MEQDEKIRRALTPHGMSWRAACRSGSGALGFRWPKLVVSKRSRKPAWQPRRLTEARPPTMFSLLRAHQTPPHGTKCPYITIRLCRKADEPHAPTSFCAGALASSKRPEDLSKSDRFITRSSLHHGLRARHRHTKPPRSGASTLRLSKTPIGAPSGCGLREPSVHRCQHHLATLWHVGPQPAAGPRP